MKVNITVTELGKAREVQPGDTINFEYYTETDVKTGKGIIQWINQNECVVKDHKGKKHQMEVSCIKSVFIAYIPEEKQSAVVENATVEQLAEREKLLKGQIVADILDVDISELCLEDLCNYHVSLYDCFLAMDKFAYAATSASGMVKVEEVEPALRYALQELQSFIPVTDVKVIDQIISAIHSLTNSK